jgi:hypothetical protein
VGIGFAFPLDDESRKGAGGPEAFPGAGPATRGPGGPQKRAPPSSHTHRGRTYWEEPVDDEEMDVPLASVPKRTSGAPPMQPSGSRSEGGAPLRKRERKSAPFSSPSSAEVRSVGTPRDGSCEGRMADERAGLVWGRWRRCGANARPLLTPSPWATTAFRATVEPRPGTGPRPPEARQGRARG